jgi:nicotinamide riboside kinase
MSKAKPHIIGVCGAQNTGKSTLISSMLDSDYFMGYQTYPSIIRSLVPQGFDFHSANIEMQMAVLHTQTMNLWQSMSLKIPTIMDRTVIDNLAYVNYYLQFDPDNFLLTDKIYNYIIEKTRILANSIDLYVYIKPEFDMVDDGLRIVDRHQQNIVALEILRLLQYFGVSGDRLCIVTGSVEERLNQVTDFCKDRH